jgi:hypothetical protein
MDKKNPLADPQKAKEVGVLSFMLNRVVIQQRMLADVIAKVEGTTEEEVLERMEKMLKQNEAETIYYLRQYWLGEERSNGQQ